MVTYDVLIIGAGPAGLACAIELTKKQISCLILEARADVSGIVCGDGISTYSIELLQKLGINTDDLPGKRIYYKKEYREQESRIFRFSDLFGTSCELGISRDQLNIALLEHALEHNVPIHFNAPCQEIEKTPDGLYIVNKELASRYLVYACGVQGGIRLGLHYPKELPLGISGRIIGKCLLEDNTFHYFFSDLYGKGYAWVFPVGENMWNIGVWSHNKKKELKKNYYELEKRFFNHGNFVYDRKPQGRIIGAGDFLPPGDPGTFYIGDCALSSNPVSGEGISYAIEEGIDVSDIIGKQIKNAKEL